MATSWGIYLFTKVLQIFFTFTTLLYTLLIILPHPIRTFKKKKRTIPPPALLDPSLGTHEYITANGIRFHYVTAGEKTKPLMLLLHGFPEFWYSWRYQLKEFSKDYHVVAVDLRGYGETDKPQDVKSYLIDALIEDVVQLIKVLSPDGKCILVAHDWGGAIAWNVAYKHPELLTSLIMMNCPHPRVFKTKLQSWKQLGMSWYMFLYQTPWLPEFLFSINDYGIFKPIFRGKKGGVKNLSNFTEDAVEAYKYTFSQPGSLTPPINYYRNILSGNKLPGNITMPVLLIWGESDAFIDVSGVEPHKKVCSNITICTIPNCSHWVQQDCPELVNQHMKEFLG